MRLFQQWRRVRAPAQKRAQPEDLAALVALLASDDAELITGQMTLRDGGVYLHLNGPGLVIQTVARE